MASSLPAKPIQACEQPRRLRVLLAEDDVEMRRLLCAALRRENCEVLEARSGVQLLELIEREGLGSGGVSRVDAIVSDVRMPGRSGLDVLMQLRSVDCSTPVILITAFGDSELHAEARRLGALAVFNKPFDLNDLRTVIVSLRR